jgi:hypothetical protein
MRATQQMGKPMHSSQAVTPVPLDRTGTVIIERLVIHYDIPVTGVTPSMRGKLCVVWLKAGPVMLIKPGGDLGVLCSALVQFMSQG